MNRRSRVSCTNTPGWRKKTGKYKGKGGRTKHQYTPHNRTYIPKKTTHKRAAPHCCSCYKHESKNAAQRPQQAPAITGRTAASKSYQKISPDPLPHQTFTWAPTPLVEHTSRNIESS